MRDVLQPMHLAIFGWIVELMFYSFVLVLALRASKALEKSRPASRELRPACMTRGDASKR
jgi:hypothetical protein